MANLTERSAITGVAGTDIFYAIKDPSGSPVGGKLTFTQAISDLNIVVTSDLSAYASASHTHDAGDVVTGTFAAGRISQASVTQHEAAIDHDALTNFVANEHVDHSSVTLTAGVGLTGGGDITANRTFDLDVNGLTAEASPDGAADYVVIYDASATGHRKVLLDDLPAGSGTDSAAIHDNVAAEISAITEKTNLAAADLLIIEDSAASNAKKRVTVDNLLTSGGSVSSVASHVSTNVKSAPATNDYFVLADPDNGTADMREFGMTEANMRTWLETYFSTVTAVNTQTGTSYTAALTDAGDIIEMNNASANTLTIPTNASVAFPVGTIIGVTQYGAGTTTVQGDTGVTVNGTSAGSEAISGQYKGASLYKRATNEWIVQGSLS